MVIAQTSKHRACCKRTSKEYNVGGAGIVKRQIGHTHVPMDPVGHLGHKIQEILMQNAVKSYVTEDSEYTTTQTRIIDRMDNI